MRIYISHSREFDFENELYKPLHESELPSIHTFIFPHEENLSGINAKELFYRKECDLIIAEVSYPSTGQGIELGWADMYELPIICLYKEGAKASESLHFVSKRFLMYTSQQNMLEDITGLLKQFE